MVHLRPESKSFSLEGNWSSKEGPRRRWTITQHAADPSTVDHWKTDHETHYTVNSPPPITAEWST